ncbi:metal ABC transporter substrate-binding protein [Candidatus Uabimicrobium sp. HlEnr_7]|uniref:metal ABC transporter substrate-binding protein n=1 Tax=Candidatus Uabimicrobium helgolandensis TaxID=3095367 RepID=UPI003557C60F
MKKVYILVLLSFLVSCDSPQKDSQKQKVIYTTFYPTAYFAERIVGDYAKVVCPVPEDEDAIFWKAYKYPKIIEEYQKADLIILNGAKFAKWVSKVSLPQDKVVNTAKPFKKEFIFIESGTKHSHGDGKEHSHKGLDGHTWVDPHNAKIQSREIKNALVKLLPQHQEKLEQNFKMLEKDFDELISTLKKYQENENKPLLASHPAYNYIARRFSWNIKNLDLNPEVMPTEEQFSEIQEILKQHPAKFILWESSPTKEIAKAFQQKFQLTSIEFSPCELISDEDRQNKRDYLSTMRNNVENLKAIWK